MQREESSVRVEDIREAGELASQLENVKSILRYISLTKDTDPEPHGQLMVSGHADYDGLMLTSAEVTQICERKEAKVLKRLGEIGVEVQ